MGGGFPSRNYFIWYVESDSFSTERYEFARGPNGVLFGDGGAGGIVTTWSKRPRFDKRAYSVNLRADSYGGYRATTDLNQPVGDRFALRLNTLYERATSWRDYTDNDREGMHLAGTFRLTQRNHVRFETEVGGHKQAIYPSYYSDQSSLWNGQSYNGVEPLSTSGTGITRVGGSSPVFVYVPGTPNGGYNDWSTFYASTGTGLYLLPNGERRTDVANFPALPTKEFNFQPPDSVAKLSYYTYSFYLDHRFNDNLFVEFSYNRLMNDRRSTPNQIKPNQYRFDINRVVPGGGTNFNYGKAYSDTIWLKTRGKNLVDDFRVLANWRFDTSCVSMP
jgi:hypothetical protein